MKRASALLVLCLLSHFSAKQAGSGSHRVGEGGSERSATTLTASRPARPAQTPAGEEKAPKWYSAVWAEWVLAVVAALTLIAVWRQAKETAKAAKASSESVDAIKQQAAIMERQTAAAQVAAQAAKANALAAIKNIEMFIGKERARLMVKLEDLNLVNVQPVLVHRVRVIITNHGPTPAYMVQTGGAAYVVPWDHVGAEETADILVTGLYSVPGVIPGGTDPIRSSLLLLALLGDKAQDMISEIMADRLFVAVRGYVKYKDVFDREHETRFRYVWKFSPLTPTPGGARGGNWQTCGTAAENEST